MAERCWLGRDWSGMRVSWLLAGLMVVGMAGVRAEAQAADMPAAQPGEAQGADRGRKLLDEMVAALGGDAWRNRQDWILEGRVATFYKGQPHEESPQFEEYYRAKPFGERVVLLSYFSTIPGLPGRNHRDLAEVWTPDAGYEVSYKGKTALPEKDVEEFQRRRMHSLDVVIGDWLKQPGTIVSYEGSGLVGRHLGDRVSILTASNDGVELALDEATHLPLSLTFQWRDPVYKRRTR